MRAKDFVEINCKFQFYNELKRVIGDLALHRKDKNATENYYDLYLIQDRIYQRYKEDLRDWKLNSLDESHKPIYEEITNAIPYQDAFNFRNHLFNVIESDKSFGYLFYLLASEKNRTEPHLLNNPIDCIPDKNIIEENIKNYQDDYPKHNLEAYLTYCDFNYSFYKENKKLLHTQDFWFSIFTDAYSLFDNLRIKMVTPFLAYDLFKEYSETNKSKKILITTLVTQLLEQYNFDLSEEQLRGKKILVDEIKNYLNSLKSGEIPADPNVRSVGWLSEHPELLTIKEQQSMLNTFKLLKDFGNEINTIFPPFELVKSKIDETSEIDEKIKILEDVIATWEVNKNIAIKHRNDDTAEEIGDKNISLFTDLLNYWKKMKELHSKTNSQNIILEKINEISLEDESMNTMDVANCITTGSYEISELYRHFSNKNAQKELFLVDKLEISLAYYASNYKNNCDNYWETYKFDPNFFNDFIPGDLLSKFNIALHEHIKPLNNQEINRYLTTSINQFKTHTPDKRKDVFCEIYHDVYWYPNYMKYTGSSARDNYVLHVWKLFSNHFQLFQEATQNTFDIFKASLTIGSTRIIPDVENVNGIKESKSEKLKSNLSRNGFLELPKVNSLSHDGQLKLIEMIILNDTPYNVALFEFIGFFKFLEFEKSLSKVAIYKKISEIFECSADTIKGNMLSLNDYSKIDKTRYTAHLHKEKVKTDYNSLK